MELIDLLRAFTSHSGSDLYLTTGAPPSARIQGQLVALSREPMRPGEVERIAAGVMNAEQRAEFDARPEMNLAIAEEGLGRFRVNIFRQRHEVAMVIRAITTDIPQLDGLNLPAVLPRLAMQKRGLVLVVGGTGSGKSTTLAAMIDHRNRNASGHIITIEDPVEFVHPHHRSIVNQREVGVDTDSYEDALVNTLRQAPDVILIGEIRHQDTMENAIAFAETGHLCLSTLHANNANQALDRIINFFPDERRNQLLLDLSLNLVAIISQRLIPTVEGGRVAAVEILLGTPRARDLVRKGDIHGLKELMERARTQGMQTFDSAVFDLWREGRISQEEALKNADSANNVRLKMTLGEERRPGEENPENSDGTPMPPVVERDSGLGNLSLEPIDDR